MVIPPLGSTIGHAIPLDEDDDELLLLLLDDASPDDEDDDELLLDEDASPDDDDEALLLELEEEELLETLVSMPPVPPVPPEPEDEDEVTLEAPAPVLVTGCGSPQAPPKVAAQVATKPVRMATLLAGASNEAFVSEWTFRGVNMGQSLVRVEGTVKGSRPSFNESPKESKSGFDGVEKGALKERFEVVPPGFVMTTEVVGRSID